MSKPETITIDEVKYVRADSVPVETIKPVLTGEFQPFEIGAVYLIRTVTMIQVGRVVAACAQWVKLEDADGLLIQVASRMRSKSGNSTRLNHSPMDLSVCRAGL